MNFTGRAGRELRRFLKAIKIDPADVWLDNVTRCLPQGRKPPTVGQIKACSQWTERALEILEPEVVVAMGAPAIKYFLNDQSVTVDEKNGRLYTKEMTGKPYDLLCMYNPAAGLNSPEQLGGVVSGFDALGLWAQGKLKPIVDEYPHPDYRWVAPDEAAEIIDDRPDDIVAVDFELNPDGSMFCWSFSTTPGTGYVVAPDPESLQVLQNLCSDKTILKLFHNLLGVDIQTLRRYGIELANFDDTIIRGYVLGFKPLGLKPISSKYLGMEMTNYLDVIGPARSVPALEYLEFVEEMDWPRPEPIVELVWDKKLGELVEKTKQPQNIDRKVRNYVRKGKLDPTDPEYSDPYNAWYKNPAPSERVMVEELLGPIPEVGLADVMEQFGDEGRELVTWYSARDADATLRVWYLQGPLIRSSQSEDVLQMDLDVIPIAAEMMRNGMLIDPKHLRGLEKEWTLLIDEAREVMWDSAGYRFNPGSTTQKTELIYEKLGMSPPRGYKKNTRRGTLEAIKLKIEDQKSTTENEDRALIVIDNLMEYSKLNKLVTTYARTLPKVASPRDGRVRTNIKIFNTSTGRWACLDGATRVLTPVGLRHLQSLKVGDRVWDGNNYVEVEAMGVTRKSKRYRIRTASGREFLAGEEHKFATSQGFVEVRNLRNSDLLLLSGEDTKIPARIVRTTGQDWMTVLGLIAADGSVDRSRNNRPYTTAIAFSPTDHDVREFADDTINSRYDINPNKTFSKRSGRVEIHRYCSVKLGEELVKWGLAELHHKITVPERIEQSRAYDRAAFLRGYFEGDGWVNPRQGIAATSVSRELLVGIQRLLWSLGVQSRLIQGRKPDDPEHHHQKWDLHVLDPQRYAQNVGFLSERKNKALEEFVQRPHDRQRHRSLTFSKWLSLPHVREVLPASVLTVGGRNAQQARWGSWISRFQGGRSDRVGRRFLKGLVDWASQNPYIQLPELFNRAVEGPLFEDPITSIEVEKGDWTLYDIGTASGTYIAEGILVHNSGDPVNLQNQPVRTKEGKALRNGFIAPPRKVLCGIDLSQIEMRVLAHVSEDDTLIDIFRRGIDMHTATSAAVLGKRIEDITDDERFSSKAINFGIVYGLSPHGLARGLNRSVTWAREFINAYLDRFPGIRLYMGRTKSFAYKYGYVQDMFGRRRYLPQMYSSDPYVVESALRAAINMPIQGPAASILKLGMAPLMDMFAAMDWNPPDYRFLMQLHDEVLSEFPINDWEEPADMIKHALETAVELSVPVLADIEIGRRWGDLTDPDTFWEHFAETMEEETIEEIEEYLDEQAQERYAWA